MVAMRLDLDILNLVARRVAKDEGVTLATGR